MAAAWQLTSTPELRDRFEITVYQLGWRLGGKGASGRDMRPAYGHRIQEHGLHIWMGFYYNAFKVMREAYAEWQQPPNAPLKTWLDAFKPHDLITLEEWVDGQWLHWPIDFPHTDGLPGEGDPDPTLWELVQLALKWLEELFKDHPFYDVGAASALLRARLHAQTLPDDPRQHAQADHHRLADWLHEFRGWLAARIAPAPAPAISARRFFLIVDLAVSTLVGLFREGALIAKGGMDALDCYEWREFLLKHGLHPDHAWSAPIRAVYDLAFGYRDGVADPAHADMGAGTTVRGVLRMAFGYKGSIFYKMQAGMGDTVFSPLYSVLRARGVRFEFFSAVQELRPSAGPGPATIEAITVQRQATVKPGQAAQGGYAPLIDVLGVASWPAEPLYDQLVEGDVLRARGIDLESSWADWPGVGQFTLRRGVDFDQVVLGISLGALSGICAPLVAANPRWKQMVEQVRTVRTQAFQLWLSKDAAGLGWDAPQRAVLGAYVEPMDTWADMSQLLAREDWPAASAPRNVAYFCGPKDETPPTPPPGPNGEFPAAALAEVKALAQDFLTRNIAYLWPRATGAGGALDWNLLVDPGGGAGQQRLAAQFFRVNIDPSERYVLSVKNSVGARMASGDSGYANLVLAGDWTRNGLSVGCVESATLSGLQAARALTGGGAVIAGENDHWNSGG